MMQNDSQSFDEHYSYFPIIMIRLQAAATQLSNAVEVNRLRVCGVGAMQSADGCSRRSMVSYILTCEWALRT